MDDFGYYKRYEILAFGSWDCYDGLPFTQRFDTPSRHPPSSAAAGLLRYSYSHDRDLYVAGDLYANDVVTPAMIVVPRRRRTNKVRGADNNVIDDIKREEKGGGKWVGDFREHPTVTFAARPTPKPVDEDLYKIPPELLLAKPKKKKGMSFLSRCLLPTCCAL